MGRQLSEQGAREQGQRRAREEMARIEAMLANSVGWGYEECRAEARRVMGALHSDLEFIDEETCELEYGWLFHFGIPTGDSEHPWEYLIGCSNDI